MSNSLKTLIFWIVMALFTFLIFSVFFRSPQSPPGRGVKSYSDFLNDIEIGLVRKVVFRDQEIEVINDDGTYRTQVPFEDPDLINYLIDKGVAVQAARSPQPSIITSILISLAPTLLLIGVWIYFIRRMQGMGNNVFSFGKSKAKLNPETGDKTTFNDVAGVDEAREELREVEEFLKDPAKFQRLGGKIPKGVLLVGPPGTGKTLLAKAIAGEADVPFFTISGSDFVELFVGVGASRVRDLFEQGRRNAPCIVFIDEIDAVGRSRGAGIGGGHDEREQTLNQLLVEMDGFTGNEGVIIIAATNRPDVLDRALLRPGRFDRRVVVDRPDIKGREDIIKIHARKIPLAADIDVGVLARRTGGFVGADLANIVNEAALLAARNGKEKVEMVELEEAIERVIAGPERKSRVLTDKEKRNTAYHEAGHALVAQLIPELDPLHKVVIVPRGMAMGYTMQLPQEDKFFLSKQDMLNQITLLLGGRVSEELILNEITTGARNDFERATKIAHDMVCAFGMSDEMGALTYGRDNDEVFLGRDLIKEKNYSEETAIQIDQEIKRIIDECHEVAYRLLNENKSSLEKVSQNLFEKEILSGDDVREILKDASLVAA